MTYYLGANSSFIFSFLEIFTIRAPYLPWLYLTISVFIENNYKDEVLGLIVGHTVFFLLDVAPRIKEVKNHRMLEAPAALSICKQQKCM